VTGVQTCALPISGSTLRARPLAFKATLALALRANVWPLLEQQKVKPIVHSVFAASNTSAAHALMESGTHVGKIVLSWEAA